MDETADIAILGGGCAGLSLAYRLIGAGRSVTVIEPRHAYEEDRVWSFWRTAPDPFEHCVVKRWRRWRVAADGRSTVRSAGGLAYETVGAGRFYDTCRHAIDRANDVSLRLGTTGEITERGAEAVTLTLSGDAPGTLRARHVIDTRPLPARPAYGQFFRGLEIETDRPRFDPECCDLMRFGPPRRDRIDFRYVLPVSPTRALVEATSFAAAPPGTDALQADLAEALAEETRGARYRVIRREAGAIPMDVAHAAPQEHPRIVPFGLRGGAARPATGYAFTRIQARADALAARLRDGHAPAPPAPDGPVMREMDRLFLRVIARVPERGPELFFRMFDRVPVRRLERFLSGSTATADRLSVIAALPPGLFLSTLARP